MDALCSMERNVIEKTDMKQILTRFSYFFDKYEHSNWMSTATSSQIQNIFCCARDIENVCSVFKTKDFLRTFEAKLTEWQKLKCNVTTHYKLQEYSTACDMILTNFYISSKVTDEVLTCATNEYLRLCGKDRFHLFKEKLICKVHTHDAVKNIIDELSTKILEPQDIFVSALGCELLRSIWIGRVQHGQLLSISECIHTTCNDKKCLDSIFRILVKEDGSEEERILKNTIIESLVLKMSTENNSDRIFWHSFINIDNSLIVTTCNLYPEILSAVMKFIIHVGKSMVVDFTETSCIWHPRESAEIIADITFSDLVSLTKCFLESRGVAGYHVRQKLRDLKSEPGCSVWVEVERQCHLPVLAKCFVTCESK